MSRTKFYKIISYPSFGMLYFFTAFVVLATLPFAYLNARSAVIVLMRFWAKGSFVLIGKKVQIKGLNHIQPNQKYLLLANHSSLFDIMAIMSFYPHVSWFGREYLLKVPLFGRVLKLTNYIPMKSGSISTTRKMLDGLLTNTEFSTVALFPEGTRSETGELGRFKKGFIHILKSAKLDVLPVTLSGFYSLKAKTQNHINFSSQLCVTIHPPIKNEKLVDKSDSEIVEAVKGAIESAYYA